MGAMLSAELIEGELKTATRLHKIGAAPSTAAYAYVLRVKPACKVFAEADVAPLAGLLSDAKFQATKNRLCLQAEALVEGGVPVAPVDSAGARDFPVLCAAGCHRLPITIGM